jgi:hypothetical protein
MLQRWRLEEKFRTITTPHLGADRAEAVIAGAAAPAADGTCAQFPDSPSPCRLQAAHLAEFNDSRVRVAERGCPSTWAE